MPKMRYWLMARQPSHYLPGQWWVDWKTGGMMVEAETRWDAIRKAAASRAKLKRWRADFAVSQGESLEFIPYQRLF